MVFIGDIGNVSLSEKIAKSLGLPILYPDVKIFPDGEQRVYLKEELGGEDVVVLKSLSTPVDSNVIQFLFILNALRESGADKVTAIIPYLGYQRADHTFRVGEAASLRVVIDAILAEGITRIMLLDPHSIKITEMFDVPVMNETALPIFAEKIRELVADLTDVTVVTPDMGGIRRIKMISEILGVEFAAVEKDRDVETGDIKMSSIHGAKPKDIVCIVDDMISSGGTMVQAINAYRKMGVKKIYAFATHAVFSENASTILQDSPVEKVFVTDSIEVPENRLFKKLEVLSIADLVKTGLSV